MKSILLILPYFGKWPIWFEAHLKSIEYNKTINWLIVTDCDIPQHYPSNIRFVATTLKELNQEVNKVMEVNVPLTPRKLCDIRPAYAEIFKEYVAGYDFWGFCDLDVIWGDIRKFMTDEMLDNNDILSSRKDSISGHFNLFRNSPQINLMYKKLPNFKKMLEEPKFMWIDEGRLTDYIKSTFKEIQPEYRVYWKSILLNQERGFDSRQEYHLDRWLWKEGKILDMKKNQEVMYLHFINWKRFMKRNEVLADSVSSKFYISYTGIHYAKHTSLQILINHFTNLFDGYYVRLKKKKFLKKALKIKKNLKNKTT